MTKINVFKYSVIVVMSYKYLIVRPYLKFIWTIKKIVLQINILTVLKEWIIKFGRLKDQTWKNVVKIDYLSTIHKVNWKIKIYSLYYKVV